ncbi:MAG: IS110 family transposase, partial [Cyanobacteria bacterium P01_G01_bin.38]
MEKRTAPAKSYLGEKVYVGIDVHKKTYTVEARVNQERVKRWTTPADPERVRDQLKKYFAGAELHSVYEAGFSGFVLHRVLVSG